MLSRAICVFFVCVYTTTAQRIYGHQRSHRNRHPSVHAYTRTPHITHALCIRKVREAVWGWCALCAVRFVRRAAHLMVHALDVGIVHIYAYMLNLYIYVSCSADNGVDTIFARNDCDLSTTARIV